MLKIIMFQNFSYLVDMANNCELPLMGQYDTDIDKIKHTCQYRILLPKYR